MTEILKVRDVAKAFGGVRVLAGVELSVAAGSVTALVGPNGAGKTTLINILAGSTALDSGEVVLAGVKLPRAEAPYARARRGIVRTFQQVRVLKSMSVADNVAFALSNGGRIGPEECCRETHTCSGLIDDTANRVVLTTIRPTGYEVG